MADEEARIRKERRHPGDHPLGAKRDFDKKAAAIATLAVVGAIAPASFRASAAVPGGGSTSASFCSRCSPRRRRRPRCDPWRGVPSIEAPSAVD
ncbi:unnamed protein product [Ectocarpus sp. 12 AP-2014]